MAFLYVMNSLFEGEYGMNFKKYVLPLAAVSLLVLSLAGCGSQESSQFAAKPDKESERTPAYRDESFLLQREQHYSSEELLRLTLSPQA